MPRRKRAQEGRVHEVPVKPVGLSETKQSRLGTCTIVLDMSSSPGHSGGESVLQELSGERPRTAHDGNRALKGDVRLRVAVRTIYDACYITDAWTPVRFDKAERHRTVHYRQAV